MSPRAKPSLKQLDDKVTTAKRDLNSAIASRFLYGATVHVKTGDNQVAARVMQTAGVRVEVMNPRTGRRYWVYAYRLAEFDEL